MYLLIFSLFFQAVQAMDVPLHNSTSKRSFFDIVLGPTEQQSESDKRATENQILEGDTRNNHNQTYIEKGQKRKLEENEDAANNEGIYDDLYQAKVKAIELDEDGTDDESYDELYRVKLDPLETDMISGDTVSKKYGELEPTIFSKEYYTKLIEGVFTKEEKPQKKDKVIEAFHDKILEIINSLPTAKAQFTKEVADWKSKTHVLNREALKAFAEALSLSVGMSTLKNRLSTKRTFSRTLDAQSLDILREIGKIAASFIQRKYTAKPQDNVPSTNKRRKINHRGGKSTLKTNFMASIIQLIDPEECQKLLEEINNGNRENLETYIEEIRKKDLDDNDQPLLLKTFSARLAPADINNKFPENITFENEAIKQNYKKLLRVMGSHASNIAMKNKFFDYGDKRSPLL